MGINYFEESPKISPTMEEKDFASVVLDSNILTKGESLKDLMKSFQRVSMSVGFPDEKRVGPCQSCCRFRSFAPANERGGWQYEEEMLNGDCITFWVDKDVMLHGIQLFGSKGNDYLVSMQIWELQYYQTFGLLIL